MNLRNLLFVCKQFWPVSGETELLAAAFVTELQKHCRHVDVLTWRMIRQWPEQFQFGKSRVVRLPPSNKPVWASASFRYYGRNRWQRSLQRSIMMQKKDYDAALVFEFEQDALAPTIIVGKCGLPVVSRIQQKHLAGLNRNVTRDLQSLPRESTSLVTPDAALLLDPVAGKGGALAGLRFIADGFAIPRRETSRQEARQILGRVHPIFQLQDEALLAVCGADLTFESGVFSLVRSWRAVADKQPDARLWLIGSGRNAPELFQRICDLDLQHSVLLTGNFDDVEDVLSAANAYIMPGCLGDNGWYSVMASYLGLTLIHHRDRNVAGMSVNRIPFDDHSRPIDLVVQRWANSPQKERVFRPAVSDVADGPRHIEAMVSEYLQQLEQVAAAT